jgi:rhomboid family GlyGly-CTERM serine protease
MSHTPSASATAITLRQASWFLGLLAAVLVLSWLGDESVRNALRYERTAVLDGEYWRLLTAHFVHGTAMHMLLNLAGLALVAALFARDYSLGEWLLILLVSIATIDAGFVFYEPQLRWYVGFSGALHGALAAGAVAWVRHESRYLALGLILLVVCKLAWEQWRGALPFSGDMEVIVDAHLYGAIGGALAAGILWLRRRD